MRKEKLDDLKLYQDSCDIQRIGNEAVRIALEENRELGIPSVFYRSGRLYYELPNGEITTDNPFELDEWKTKFKQKLSS